MTLIDVNKKINNAVQRGEFEYWMERRREFYELGLDFMNETIEEDIKMGILTKEGEWNE